MPRRSKRPAGVGRSAAATLQRHLLGTMFDPSRLVERVLSTGTVVRLRVEEIDELTVMVHEARRRRRDGSWERWPDVEGEQSVDRLRLDQSRVVNDD